MWNKSGWLGALLVLFMLAGCVAPARAGIGGGVLDQTARTWANNAQATANSASSVAATDAANITTVSGVVSTLNTPVNNTGAGADITLAVGQSAYVDISAATSAPLHIATADMQMYRLMLACNGNSGSGSSVYLNPNNTTYTNIFVLQEVNYNNGAGAVGDIQQNAFVLAYAQDPVSVNALISTATAHKSVVSIAFGFNSPYTLLSVTGSRWNATASTQGPGDTTTAWTSLGTLTFPVAATCRATVKRLQ